MPLEKGKLVRQLSLVSYLMAMNRPVTARDVRECVEGYAEMGDDAFARRFYADRTELLGLGIPLRSNRDDDTGEELYTLSEKHYFLPALDMSDHEISSLQSCLSLLDGQFAYAEPLRLALQNLTLGRPNPATDQALASTTIRLVGSDYSAEIAARIAKLETAITKRRTVTFEYYTISRDETMERVVDPYALIWNGGQWYLVGHSHERNDVRVFRLTRIRGEIKFTSRRERDFEVPEDFDASIYRTRPTWQLGGSQGEAELWVDSSAAWWVERSFGHSGRVEHHSDGSMTFFTDFASTRYLASWICGMNGLVRPVGPQELVEDVAQSVAAITDAHSGATPELPVQLPVLEEDETLVARRKRPAAPVSAEQFALLQALMADLLASCGTGREGYTPIADVKQRYGLDDRGVQDAVSLLTLVNFGAGAYTMYAEIRDDQIYVETEPDGEVFRRPARLSPLEAKALLLALDLVGPLVAATASSDLTSVRQKLDDAFGGYAKPSVPATEPNNEDQYILTQLTAGLREHKLLHLEYYSQRAELSVRDVEPYALQRMQSHWYLVAWCRKAEDVRSFRLDRIKTIELLKETFEPRDLDLSGYAADTPASLADAPRVATVWFAPDVARWIVESRSDATRLVDGSALLDVAAATDQWLLEEILKYRGLATIVSPGAVRSMVAKRAKALGKEMAKVPVPA